ncbi:MAG: hypothetical protein IJ333_02835 [Clostridia bacterium]|nr:hypothetical protein [Clostridia bacterium]
MKKIRFVSSVALDAICFIQQRLLKDKKWMNKAQLAEIESINRLLPPDFGDNYIGMSNLSLILSVFTDNCLESTSLKELISIFQRPDLLESVIKDKIKNEFTASYIVPILELLKDGYADEYIKKLLILKDIGFEQRYQEQILPLVESEIRKNEEGIFDYNTEQLFQNISVLKNKEIISDSKIVVSFFSAPTAFTLCNGSFLTCFTPKGAVDFFSIIAHELMHGFASGELIDLYREYVDRDEYLREMHTRLINEFHSGVEEEFVLAAEYYLCLQSGHYSKSALLQKAKERYGGACPVSVILFDMLSKEKQIPKDYNQWLKHPFTKGYLPQSNIKDFVDSL